MGLFDRHNLLNLNDLLLVLNNIKDSKRSADMEAIDCRGMRALKFLLVPPRKRIFCEFKNLQNDDAPGLLGEFFEEIPSSLLNGK